jgi:hypothetical protein
MAAVVMPANYRDPAPPSDKMGWGEKRMQAAHNLLVEAQSQEGLPLVMAGDAQSAGTINPKILKIITSKFKFDGPGWDCMVAERLLYGLSEAETLMINQTHGNCVGNSHAALLASRIAHEVFAVGDLEEPLGRGQMAMPFIPYTYGVGRWVGGMLGPGDGSYCGAQIKGSMEHGFLPASTPGLEKYAGSGNAALPQGTASSGKLFGRSKSEIQKWTDKATPFDLVEAPKVRNFDDLWTLLIDKKFPAQICSGVMPSFTKNDPKYGPIYDGFTGASHSTQIPAVFEFKGQRFYAGRNQWGLKAHYGNPLLGIAGGCYVCTAEHFDRWMKKGAEVIAIGEIKGLKVNPGA